MKNDFKSYVKNIEKNITNSKSIVEEATYETVFNNSFIKNNTSFSSFNEMLKSSDCKIEDNNFTISPEDTWNNFIIANSNFKSWQSMIDKALEEYQYNYLKKLGF